MTSQVVSVTELTTAIRSILEPHFRSIQVRGEISNFKLQSSGHLYFSLKDANAQISAALFRTNAAKLSRMPKDGDQVVAVGELSVYPPRGNYQIIVRELQFLGVGELLLKLHQLKEALEKRGLFDANHKKPIPKLPRRIGVITSPTGAVIQDILNILTRRFAGFQVLLYPVKVQGDGAALEIAQAIHAMNQYELADVLIVGRGGGSIEDLWAFNEEIVAQAIFDSRIPIISAVGHETDFTIADWVADLRAPTPSAAAEMVIAEKSNLLKTLEKASIQSRGFLTQQIQHRKMQVNALYKHPLLCQPHSLLAERAMRFDDMKQDVEDCIHKTLQENHLQLASLTRQLELVRPSQQIFNLREKLQTYTHRIDEAMNMQLSRKKQSLAPFPLDIRPLKNLIASKKNLLVQIRSTFESIHPKNLLKKGYSILFSEKEHSIILSVNQLPLDQPFIAVLSDGRIRATVQQTEKNGPNL